MATDQLTALTALSPLDGRYEAKLAPLRPILSEYGLIYYRVMVEIRWLLALLEMAEINPQPLPSDAKKFLLQIIEGFSIADAEAIKAIEKKTNHDVKAIEYFIQQKLADHKYLREWVALIHFGCTSEDINNLAYALMLQKATQNILQPIMQELIQTLLRMANDYASIPMLSRTHGQPASPTTLGKELINFVVRFKKQFTQLQKISLPGKFNGAVGNFNAHRVAYPEIDWPAITKKFVASLGLEFNAYSTQIEPHDQLIELLQILQRFNTILIDFNRDVWGYISMGYFVQKKIDTEVGSSTMPHKVNPIDFENSEGNLGLANALIQHFAEKLPISRWQRDLTDSTVLRNCGSIYGYIYLSYQATLKGLSKLTANEEHLRYDLEQHWEVLAEAIQTVMRRYKITDAYEQLKNFTRGKKLDGQLMQAFIEDLKIPDNAKKELKALTPSTYLGYAIELSRFKDKK